jgi:hypothetical protein
MKKWSRDFHQSFVGLERRLFHQCPEFRDLTPRAIVLYLHLKSKYNGGNNGDLSLHYSEVKGARDSSPIKPSAPPLESSKKLAGSKSPATEGCSDFRIVIDSPQDSISMA